MGWDDRGCKRGMMVVKFKPWNAMESTHDASDAQRLRANLLTNDCKHTISALPGKAAVSPWHATMRLEGQLIVYVAVVELVYR